MQEHTLQATYFLLLILDRTSEKCDFILFLKYLSGSGINRKY